MNYRFCQMVRGFALGASAAMVLGGFYACKDDYDLDDEGNYPSWLGGSIYEALKNPESLNTSGSEVLSGSFSNYLRLVDDLGYAETLGKTGSKTVFPANDEAFNRFFANNSWGVSRYEDLTLAMKKQLLYGSMLDNALLVEMLSNISATSTSVTQGMALKHTTSLNVIDTISYLVGKNSMPANNPYWEKFYDKGIHLVMDATRPLMVHFTEEQMTANGIKTSGEDSDFEIITGTPYDEQEHSAYIFRNKIIHADVTCKNGYIHQMQDVLLPPGNLAQVIRTSGESSYFSRMLDRFCAPYYNAETTKNYNDYAVANNLATIDSIYQLRYMSLRSQGSKLERDPDGVAAKSMLDFDPGWNNYNNGTGEDASKDIAAMFVPTDEAMEKYFLPGGEGEFLINTFGKKVNGQVLNDREHLNENIDSIPLGTVTSLVTNLMNASFVGSVPSKFGHVMDEASDPMGLDKSFINKVDGVYDVKIANNGVVYMLNHMFAPPSLIAVSAPVSLVENMKIMREAVEDGGKRTNLDLGLNYYAYLLAMSANYAFFIPTDEAFGTYYIDPAYLNASQPRALRFYYSSRSPYVFCSAWKYNKKTNTVGTARSDSLGRIDPAQYRTQLTDILNYHTLVLASGEKLGENGNKYYKTKHGGAIRFEGDKVLGGAQIEGLVDVPNITQDYNQKNGMAYAIDHIIQAPTKSVYDILTDERFSDFMALCNDMRMDSLMDFASDKMSEKNTVTQKELKESYKTFVSKRPAKGSVNGLFTDNTVNYFSSFNYTVFAPDNDAMKEAHDRGLPRWSDVGELFDQYRDLLEEQRHSGHISDEVQAARDKALAMIEEINSFVRYHFQDNSVFADKVVESGEFPTACSDTLGIRERLNVSGGSDKLIVVDKLGQRISIDANESQKIINQMARDYVIDVKNGVRSISTSSFAVIHQISKPLSYHNTTRYDGMWSGAGARKRLAAFRKLYETELYKQRY